ncbi:hypothetical protein GCK32_003213 [Trichostrongylus colubriformis]|uniref:Nucleoporin NSP1-like C-terminal domain-containing protein n=1 Tax=Trichostrongylus colubriformis TaxID=6319 RepID=A0AAN8IIJ1_TRICO
MFGTSSISTTPSTGTTTTPLFSAAAPVTSTSTAQAPLSFGATSFSSTPQSAPKPAETSTTTTTEAASADASTGSSLKQLLEKEGSVGSACSQLLASMTADTEINFADLAAITQKMTLDLASDERAFLNCLLELNAYDRQLWDNMQKISDVDSKLVALEEKQSKMIYNMGCITEEQKALDSAVSELEKALGLPDWTDQNHDLPLDAFSATPSDTKRQQLMQMLISVDSQIKEADCDLQEIIDQVAALHKSKTSISNANKATEDQVAQILKNQMETLLYIDRKAGELETKVEEFKDITDGRNSSIYM